MGARDPYNRREGGTVAGFARKLAERAEGVSSLELAERAFVDRNTAAAALSILKAAGDVHSAGPRGAMRYFTCRDHAAACQARADSAPPAPPSMREVINRLARRAEGVGMKDLVDEGFDAVKASQRLSELAARKQLCRCQAYPRRYFAEHLDAARWDQMLGIPPQPAQPPGARVRPPDVRRRGGRPAAVAAGVNVPKPDLRPTAAAGLRITADTKFTRVPTPVDTRFTVGGFASEWLELRRHGAAHVAQRRAADTARRAQRAGGADDNPSPTPSIRSAES